MTAPQSSAAGTTGPGSSSSPASSSVPSTELPLQDVAPSLPTAPALAAAPGLSLMQLVTGVNIHSRVKVTLDLQGNNFTLWRFFMELVIDLYKLRAHLSPDFDNHDGDHDWRIINLTVKSWLFSTMTLELASLLAKPGATTAAVWASIEGLFLHNRRARQVYLGAELLDQKQGDHPVSTYIVRLKRVADNMRNIGKELPDDELVVALLKGLSDRHKLTGALIRRSDLPLDFQTAVNMLLLDEVEAGGSRTSPPSDSALAAYARPPAPSGFGAPAAGSPSPNQGKTKRKRTANNDGYNHGSPSPVAAPVASQQAPWTSYVHAYPVPMPPLPRVHAGPGVLGARPQAYTALAPCHYAMPPTAFQSPYYGIPPPMLAPALGHGLAQSAPHPYHAYQPAYTYYSPHQVQRLPAQVPQQVQQTRPSDAHGVDQAALMGACTTCLCRTPPTAGSPTPVPRPTSRPITINGSPYHQF